MNDDDEQVTVFAKDLLVSTLGDLKLQLGPTLIVCAIFNLCCPNPRRTIGMVELKAEMEKVAVRYGIEKPSVTIAAVPCPDPKRSAQSGH